MRTGILNSTENRILDVFQEVGCGEGLLSVFFCLFNFVCCFFC